jgi:dimethylhistidine N-methyltransferase
MAAQPVDHVPLLHTALEAARERNPESPPPGVVRRYDFLEEGEGFREDVLTGLSQREKTSPWRALFDTTGQQLFDRVCAQPEYLAYRTEKNILNANLGEIIEFVGGDCQFINVGNHSAAATRLLIEHLRPSIYAPIDYLMASLNEHCDQFAKAFPWLNICALYGDFLRPLHLPRFTGVKIRFKSVFLLGGAFARFTASEVPALLGCLRALAGPSGRVIITLDQTADWQILQGAYNDQRGAMEAFNANAIRHINRALHGDLQMARFHHVADFDAKQGLLAMALESQYSHFANIAGRRFDFVPGEFIRTAIHRTYGIEEFQALAQKAGLRIEKSWSDTHNLCAVHALVAH